MNVLYLIPARGGSKGIVGKNIREFNGRPLISYTIEAARQAAGNSTVCVSTDSAEILSCVNQLGLDVPFLRPAELATDSAGAEGVILHALSFYEGLGENFDVIVYLQPTSPFRTAAHVFEALSLYTSDIDMVVSTFLTKANPYYLLFEEDDFGFLRKSKSGNFLTRQECPPVYEYNGAIYVINVSSLKDKGLEGFTRIRKYEMSRAESIDLDDDLDWLVAEALMKNREGENS